MWLALFQITSTEKSNEAGLEHKYSRGETIVLCRLCAKRADVTRGFLGKEKDYEILREVLRSSQM